MQLNMSKTREQFPLSRRKILKKTISSTLGWMILGLIFWGLIAFVSGTVDELSSNGSYFLLGISSLAIGVFLFLVVGLTYWYQSWYFAVYFYDLTQDYIVIKKGPITPREITIPYERIQDVYVDQDLLDRIMGLYDVHLSSATASSGMEAHIDGVEKQAADGLRTMLLQAVGERISKKTPAPAAPQQ